jgi:hypothetical protein
VLPQTQLDITLGGTGYAGSSTTRLPDKLVDGLNFPKLTERTPSSPFFVCPTVVLNSCFTQSNSIATASCVSSNAIEQWWTQSSRCGRSSSPLLGSHPFHLKMPLTSLFPDQMESYESALNRIREWFENKPKSSSAAPPASASASASAAASAASGRAPSAAAAAAVEEDDDDVMVVRKRATASLAVCMFSCVMCDVFWTDLCARCRMKANS